MNASPEINKGHGWCDRYKTERMDGLKPGLYSRGERHRQTDVSCYELGWVGSVFGECCDYELMAVSGSDMKGSVSALVFTIYLSPWTQSHT